MDDDPIRDKQDDPARRAAPILSAGVPAAPVDWTAPGADGTAGAAGDPRAVGKGMVLAGVGTRLAAFLVDFFILGCVAVAITLIASSLIPDRTTADAVPAIISAVLAVLYFAIAWLSRWAATPGQRLAGLQVVDAATIQPIDPARAFIRSLALGSALTLLSFAAPVGQVVGAVLIIWPFVLFASTIYDARHQGLHDRWTRTLVVKPVDAGAFPLTVGCFLIVLIILAAPLIMATVAGPALEDWLRQIPPPNR